MAWSFWGSTHILKLSRSPSTVTSIEQKTLLSSRKFQGILECRVKVPNIRIIGGGHGFVMTYQPGRIKYILRILITNVSLTAAKNSAHERDQFRQRSQGFFFKYDKDYPGVIII